MFLIGFPADMLATNCFLLARAPGEDCVVVDPGGGIDGRLNEALRTHRLTPSALLLTHGHLDHTASVPQLAETYDVPTYIHVDDEYRLTDPMEQLGPEFRAMLEMQYGDIAWTRPGDVVTYADGDTLSLAGLDLTIAHAPGHTEGSALFTVEDLPDAMPEDSGLSRTILAGDVLFSGGIGRTDLYGGDDAAMQASLRDVVLSMPDDSLVLPGHGPATTIGRERATNPFLAHLA
ncbi:MBL fold metallo-hydrolase [Mobilicoccus sp.]|uniref:MBL fold metallo-hydrolase n=1 Tax=Mobilicoccus sp. TaxID=2034349 RepID=UPI0028A5E587|nr:MBL fold metallo-hydrolase [Mobilicoccus sp.]